MTRSSRETVRTFVAILVLCGLVVGVALRRKRAAQKNELEESSKKLVSLDLGNVQQVELVNKEGRVVLKRRPKDGKGKHTDRWAELSYEFDSIPDWYVSEPYESLPDFPSLNTLMENLREAAWEKVISEKGERAADYHLAKPAATIRLFEKNGGQPSLSIDLGDKNSAESGIYLRTSKDPKIVLGNNTLDYLKARSPKEWRKKEIIGFQDLAKVTRLSLVYFGGAKGRFILKKMEGKWQIEDPKTLPGDQAKIDEFLSNVKTLRANEIVSEDAVVDAKKFGLDHPYAHFTIAFDSPDGRKEREIVVGGKIEKDKDIYLRRSDLPQVFSVRGSLKDSLTLGLAQLVNKRLVGSDVWQATSVAVERAAGENLEIVKKDGKWSVAKPSVDRADDGQVNSFLSNLENLQAEEFIGETAPAGTSTKLATIRSSTDKKAQELEVWRGKDERRYIVRTSQPTLYYFVEKSKWEDIANIVRDVRDRRILPFEPGDLASLSLKKGSVSVRYSRRSEAKEGESFWTLGSLEGAESALKNKLRAGTVADSILDTLKGLKIDSFEGAQQVAENDPNTLRVEVRPKEGAGIHWLFGKKENGKRFVKSVERNVTGTVEDGIAEELDNVLKTDLPTKG